MWGVEFEVNALHSAGLPATIPYQSGWFIKELLELSIVISLDQNLYQLLLLAAVISCFTPPAMICQVTSLSVAAVPVTFSYIRQNKHTLLVISLWS